MVGSALLDRMVEVTVGSIVGPFFGSYSESDKVIPNRNYYGASQKATPVIEGSNFSPTSEADKLERGFR